MTDELTALYKRKNEINAALDASASTAFHEADDALLDELELVCSKINVIEEREIYSNICPCNF